MAGNFTAGAQPIATDTALHHGTLSNGFQYFIRHNSSPANRAMLYLVNKVGSILEDEDQQGLAHFMEHMNFNGTSHYPKNVLEDFLQKAGVQFGADLNAYTSHDETVYELPIPTEDPQMVLASIGIIRDWAQNALLDEEEINKERGVVLEEERLGLGKDQRMRNQYLPVLLNHSRYARRIPIGSHEILTSFKPEQLRRFHRDWYRPNLQAIIVVGDIDVKTVKLEIERRFSDLKNPTKERPRKDYSIQLNGKNNFAVVTDPEQAQISLNLLIKHTSREQKTESDYLFSIKKGFMTDLLSDRFNTLDQAPDKAFMQAGASITQLLGGLDAFSFLVVPKEGHLKEAFMQGWRVVEQALRHGFTKTELDRVRTSYKQSMTASLKEANKVHSRSYIQQYKMLFLKDRAVPSIQWKYDFMLKHIDQIVVEDLLAILRQYVQDNNRQYLLLAPDNQKGQLPDSATVLSWFKQVQTETIAPYEEKVVEGELLPEKPTPGRIVHESKIDSLNVTVLQMSNGVKVLLKPTDYQNNQIIFNGFAPGGISLSDSNNYISASNSAPLISMMGVGQYTQLELQKLLNAKMVGAGAYIGGRSQGVNGSAIPNDLETALQLVYLRMTAPRKDPVQFNNSLNDARQSLAHKYVDPNNVFQDTVSYILGNYHYRNQPFTIDKLEKINLDSAFAFYQQSFADASGFTFVFVGNFNVDSIKPLLTTYLGGLPALHQHKKARDLGIHIPAGRLSKIVRAGSEDKASVQMVVSGDYPYNEKNNMGIYFLGQILQVRLLEVLREGASEVYSPRVNASNYKYPESRYSFSFSFGCSPANADHLIELVNQELKDLREKGPSQVDIDKVKAAYQKQMDQSKNNNGFWLSYLTGRIQNKEDLLHVYKIPAVLKEMTPDFLQQLSIDYLSGENQIDFKLLPVD